MSQKSWKSHSHDLEILCAIPSYSALMDCTALRQHQAPTCCPYLLHSVTLMWHCWQILASPKSWQSPLSLPQDLRDFQNFSSVLKLGCYHTPTLPLVPPPRHSPPTFRVFRPSEPRTHQFPTLFPFIGIFSCLLFLSDSAFLCLLIM